jgi:signal peptidase I
VERRIEIMTTEENDYQVITDEPDEKPVKKKKYGFVVELIVYVVLIIICIYYVPEYVLQRTVVQGESMESTLQTKDSLLVEKFTKFFKNPEREDIIVFSPYKDTDEFYVKRVIGLPGETIQIKGDDIFINGSKIEDIHSKDHKMFESGIAEEQITLGPDEFFVMGDNRRESLDSRDKVLGPIHESQIEGKVILRIWPLNKFGIP